MGWLWAGCRDIPKQTPRTPSKRRLVTNPMSLCRWGLEMAIGLSMQLDHHVGEAQGDGAGNARVLGESPVKSPSQDFGGRLRTPPLSFCGEVPYGTRHPHKHMARLTTAATPALPSRPSMPCPSSALWRRRAAGGGRKPCGTCSKQANLCCVQTTCSEVPAQHCSTSVPE